MKECPICGKYMKSLGYASHRAMHYRKAREENSKNDKEEVR